MAVDLSSVGREAGLRFQFVNVLPATTVVVFSGALALSGAWGSAPSFARFRQALGNLTLTEIALVLFSIFILSIAANSFQSQWVKLLEGYWKPVGAGVVFLHYGLSRHGTIRFRLGLAQSGQRAPSLRHRLALRLLAPDRRPLLTAMYQARMDEEFGRYPTQPDEDQLARDPLADRLMPTRLGNALRTAEDLAGDRYGFPAVTATPYLLSVAHSTTLQLVEDARTELDVAAKFVLVWLVCTLVGAAALYDDGPWLFVAASTFVLARISYEAALSAALGYGRRLVELADLHRFDLMKKLHWPLPRHLAEEQLLNASLWRIVGGSPTAADRTRPYDHAEAGNPTASA